MAFHRIRAGIACAAALTIACTAIPAHSAVVDLASIKPQCSGPFDLNNGACVLSTDKLAKTEPGSCTPPSLRLSDDKKTCTAVEGKAPAPNCGNALPDLVIQDGKCVVDRKTPTSSIGDYMGDCFKILALPQPNPLGLVAGQHLEVESQVVDGDDRVLTVADADSTKFGYFCRAKVGANLKTIRASDLNNIGAERLGWTYGMLTLPFKYYAHDKSFVSAGSLGPYVGRRSGAAGSAITFAGTVAIGSVKGEVKDNTGTITDTPDLLALSVAAGWMYDITKSAGAKPFKIGVFVGRDFVGKGNAVKYPRAGQYWAAFQIG